MYAYIAGLSDHDKIMSGVQVYGFDYAEGLRTLSPLTLEAYGPFVEHGKAAETIVRPFVTGSGYQPLP